MLLHSDLPFGMRPVRSEHRRCPLFPFRADIPSVTFAIALVATLAQACFILLTQCLLDRGLQINKRSPRVMPGFETDW
jgi:hypothetical protein